MNRYRTDLAIEEREIYKGSHTEVPGVEVYEVKEENKVKITGMNIFDKIGERLMKKPCGNYITIECEDMFYEEGLRKEVTDKTSQILKKLIKDNEKALIVGLGNRFATPDALGPLTVDKIKIEEGKKAIEPSVYAKTGMESSDIVEAVVKKINPDVVIVVDALAARDVKRLTATVQITDTGICPGSGVGNNRKELNEKTLGVPVIAIGVPMVVDMLTIAEEFAGPDINKEKFEKRNMYVTPKDIDEVCNGISEMIANAINMSL